MNRSYLQLEIRHHATYSEHIHRCWAWKSYYTINIFILCLSIKWKTLDLPLSCISFPAFMACLYNLNSSVNKIVVLCLVGTDGADRILTSPGNFTGPGSNPLSYSEQKQHEENSKPPSLSVTVVYPYHSSRCFLSQHRGKKIKKKLFHSAVKQGSLLFRD